MKNIIIVLLVINGFVTSAQNNAIFQGGNGDGVNKVSFAQASNNIFTGGSGDGWNKISYSQTANNIFSGGNGDGWNKTSFIQAGNAIFNGGIGDGWHKTSYLQAGNNIFTGGRGDGWSSTYRPMGTIPVNFLYFNASKQGQTSALLNWKTAQEINSAYFDVERSTDAINYAFIGKVNAAGNSSVPVEYFFTDNFPATGFNYYRLKQVDLDGHFIYTPSRMVRFDEGTSGTIKYYPNPTNGILNIELTKQVSKETKVVNITNLAGIVLDQFRLEANMNPLLQLDLSKYPKGVYFVQVKTASVNSVQRVVLQ